MKNEFQISELLDRTREEIRLADQKASILLAGITALLGIEFGSLAKILAEDTSCKNVITLIHFAFLFAAIFGLVAVLFPRRIRIRIKPSSVGYFGDVNWYVKNSEESDEFATLLELLGSQDRSHRALFEQLILISRITYKKFMWIRFTIINLCFSFISVCYLIISKAL